MPLLTKKLQEYRFRKAAGGIIGAAMVSRLRRRQFLRHRNAAITISKMVRGGAARAALPEAKRAAAKDAAIKIDDLAASSIP